MLLVVAAAVLPAIGMWYTAAWRTTHLREAYLPELEEQVRVRPRDGRLLAVLGGRLASAQEIASVQKADSVLAQAVAAGERNETVWLTRAYAVAIGSNGDRDRVEALLRKSREATPGEASEIDAAIGRVRTLDPAPDPFQLANAVLPGGGARLLAIYAPGSFLDGASEWWGQHHPEQSGLATRERWAQDEPRNPEALRLWALALLEERRFADASDVIVRASALAPASADIHLAHARILESAGLQLPARDAYLKTLKLSANCVPALLGAARCLKHSSTSFAIVACQRATRLEPGSADAWIGLGDAELESVERSAGALRAFQTAERLAPNRTDYWVDYAIALQQNGRAEEGERLLRRFLEQHPGDERGQQELGALLLRNRATRERLAEAETLTRAAMTGVPHWSAAEQQMGEILLRQERIPEATRYLQAANADAPWDSATLRLLSRAAAQAGRPLDAARNAERADRLLQTAEQIQRLRGQVGARFRYPAYHQELARLYRSTGQVTEAEVEERLVQSLAQNAAPDTALQAPGAGLLEPASGS